MRILVVEDEKKLANSIRKGLREASFAVDVAYEGEVGLELAEESVYDLIILDITLPKKDGFEIVEALRRKKNQTPVIFLSAKQSVEDRVKGLNLGADDYLPKPFSFPELLARVRALGRRKSGHADLTIKVCDLTLNLATREVRRGERKIDLRPKEFSILQYLMENAGRVITRTMLMNHVWDYSFESASNVIDVHVRRLREKIDLPKEKKLIATTRGVGYRIG
jgi:heavy metal response regulator